MSIDRPVIQIVSGTDRPDCNAIRVARYMLPHYQELGADASIVDLRDFPTASVKGGRYGSDIPEVEAFVQPIIDADGLVFVIPEYNGGYPGILKLMIDYLPFPSTLERKPICFVGESAGAFGAMRAVEQLQMVVGYRNAHVFPERVFISRVNENFDIDNGIRDEFQQGLLENQMEGFVEFVRTILTRNLSERQ